MMIKTFESFGKPKFVESLGNIIHSLYKDVKVGEIKDKMLQVHDDHSDNIRWSFQEKGHNISIDFLYLGNISTRYRPSLYFWVDGNYVKSDSTFIGRYLEQDFLKSTISEIIEQYTKNKTLNSLFDEVNLDDIHMIFEDVKDSQVLHFEISHSQKFKNPLDRFILVSFTTDLDFTSDDFYRVKSDIYKSIDRAISSLKSHYDNFQISHYQKKEPATFHHQPDQENIRYYIKLKLKEDLG